MSGEIVYVRIVGAADELGKWQGIAAGITFKEAVERFMRSVEFRIANDHWYLIEMKHGDEGVVHDCRAKKYTGVEVQMLRHDAIEGLA